MIQERVANLRETMQREDVKSISRRYFMSNGFDGTLTSIGITVGSFLSGVDAGLTVVKVGVGAAVGLSTSGVWSVWEIEKAEKLADLHEKERAMQTELTDTKLMSEMEDARIVNAISSGIGPIIGILTPVSPYLLEGIFYNMFVATILSVLMGMGLLFLFGVYMAKISGIKWYIAGLRMALAGLVVAAINIALPG